MYLNLKKYQKVLKELDKIILNVKRWKAIYSKESSEKHKMSNGVEGLVPLDIKIYFMVSKVKAM